MPKPKTQCPGSDILLSFKRVRRAYSEHRY
jgi:hypothetical protein